MYGFEGEGLRVRVRGFEGEGFKGEGLRVIV